MGVPVTGDSVAGVDVMGATVLSGAHSHIGMLPGRNAQS